jgi:hypothetical protein
MMESTLASLVLENAAYSILSGKESSELIARIEIPITKHGQPNYTLPAWEFP